MWTNVDDFSKVHDSFYGRIKLKTKCLEHACSLVGLWVADWYCGHVLYMFDLWSWQFSGVYVVVQVRK